MARQVAVGGSLVDLRTPGAHYHELFLALHGAHQGDNAACALAAAEAFFGAPLAPEVVEHAMGNVRVPGRFEIVGALARDRARRGPQRGRRTRPGRHHARVSCPSRAKPWP